MTIKELRGQFENYTDIYIKNNTNVDWAICFVEDVIHNTFGSDCAITILETNIKDGHMTIVVNGVILYIVIKAQFEYDLEYDGIKSKNDCIAWELYSSIDGNSERVTDGYTVIDKDNCVVIDSNVGNMKR